MGAEPGEAQPRDGASLPSQRWAAHFLSVAGEGHKRRLIPCQDASDAGVLGTGQWAYAIVADGHGSSRHFRSDRGARIAVEVLRAAFEAVATQPSDSAHGAQHSGLTPKIWSEWAARHVVAQWRSRVWADLLEYPPAAQTPTTTEPGLGRYLEDVLARDGYTRHAALVLQVEAFRQFAAAYVPDPDEPLPLASDAAWDADRLGNWQAAAYGTTLLGVLVGPDAVFVLQQGDGAIVEVRDGEAQHVVPPPPDAFANATPSMCNDAAVHEIVATSRPISDTDSLAALVLSTDGIPNSYTTPEGFLAFCSDVTASGLRDPGLDDKLRQWLPQISAKGSQDDMSVALLLNRGSLPSVDESSDTSSDPPSPGQSVTVVAPHVSPESMHADPGSAGPAPVQESATTDTSAPQADHELSTDSEGTPPPSSNGADRVKTLAAREDADRSSPVSTRTSAFDGVDHPPPTNSNTEDTC